MSSKQAAVAMAAQTQGPTVASLLMGKDRRLEVMSAVPLVLSTPVGLLAEQIITDKKYLFVRNIQDLARGMTLEPLPLEGWEIELVGLINPFRVVIRAEELSGMDQVEYEMILQCSGNGRSQFRNIPGTPWDQGAVGNVRFAGVPLNAILEKYKVSVDSKVKFVTAEGHDLPLGLEKPDFEHSLPVAPVLEKSIFALKLNGEPLPGIHGGPVRLVTPGLFGTMQVKWLRRLRFETAESPNFYHATEYRVPLSLLKEGEKFRFTMENSRPTWDIRLMSYILKPESGAKLKAGNVTIDGVAYNDGSVRSESVLVSFDRGQNWQPAKFEVPESPSRIVPTGAQLFESGPGGSVVQIPTPGNINTVSTNQVSTVTANFPINSPTTPLYSNAAACGDGFVKPAGFLTPIQPCEIVAVNRNLRSPYVSTWTFGIQRAITNNLSLEVTYVGNHGTKLISLNDLNEPPIGVGWTTPYTAAQIAALPPGTISPADVGLTASQICINTAGSTCVSNRAAEIQAQPFTAPCTPPVGLGTTGHCFSYLSNIMYFSNGYHSNYNGLQVTMTQRTSHGLSFTAGYTYSHSLDNASDNWGSGLETPTALVNPAQSVYGSSNFDIRNRFTFSGTYLIPGKPGYAQMLQGWSINTVVTLQGGQPWGVNDQTTDFSGTGEIFNPVIGAPAGNGIAEQWDFFGNPHDFTPVHGWTDTNGGINQGGAGGVPYFSGTSNPTCLARSTAMGPLAIASLTNLGCYAVGNSVLVPPPYGTLGSTARNLFTGPGFRDWDFSVSKEFKVMERITAQFRVEFFNILNHPTFTNPFGGPGGGPSPSTDPSQGPGFGINAVTPDVAASNPVLGSGGARAMQLGLKLVF